MDKNAFWVWPKGFGMDMQEFSWVPLWLKDQKYQEQVAALENQVRQVQAELRAKDEVRQAVARLKERLRLERPRYLAKVLGYYQGGVVDELHPSVIVSGGVPGTSTVLGGMGLLAHDFLFLMDSQTVEEALKLLPEGISQEEREKRIKGLQDKIRKLRDRIREECWPPDRYVYDEFGKPLPGRDRWKEVVEHWEKMARSKCEPCDLEGYALEPNTPIYKAFHDLGLDKKLNQYSGIKPPKRQTQS